MGSSFISILNTYIDAGKHSLICARSWLPPEVENKAVEIANSSFSVARVFQVCSGASNPDHASYS